MTATLGDRILTYMEDIKADIRAIQIVTLEDSDPLGNPIKQLSMEDWNDRILIVRNTGEISVNTLGTTEPGKYYTLTPMNIRGAARIALGHQTDIWGFGDHRGQKALVQIAPIEVFRDKNKDGFRTGDIVTMESDMGLNFHSTGKTPGFSPTSIGRWSAGCVVTQNSTVFYNEIMPLLRYSGRTKFSITNIDPSLLW